MNKDFSVKLSVEIEDPKTIEKKFDEKLKTVKPTVKANVDVDANGATKAVTGYNSLKDSLQAAGLEGEELNDILQKQNKIFTNVKTVVNSVGQTVTQYTSNSGKLVEVTQRVNNEETEFKTTVTTLNNTLSKNAGQISSLNSEYKEYNDVLKSLNVDLSSYSRLSKSVDSNGNVVEKWTNNSGSMITLNGKLIDGQTKYVASIKEVDDALDTNAKQADKWRYSWSKAFQSFTTYMTVSSVFYQIIHVIQDMITEVTELDSALVELQKVTTLTGDSLKEFTKDAYDAAQNVAKTGTEMINAATEFAKAGFDEDMSLQLGEIALMYTNIADEAVTAAESSEFIIAQLKAFNLEAEDAMHVIDAVNEVANKFAVSSADIANNIGNASAVMANAGNTLEETIGLLTAGTEITRSASKVSNGKKTKPYIYGNIYINTILNPVIPKAYDNYNVKMRYA